MFILTLNSPKLYTLLNSVFLTWLPWSTFKFTWKFYFSWQIYKLAVLWAFVSKIFLGLGYPWVKVRLHFCMCGGPDPGMRQLRWSFCTEMFCSWIPKLPLLHHYLTSFKVLQSLPLIFQKFPLHSQSFITFSGTCLLKILLRYHGSKMLYLQKADS